MPSCTLSARESITKSKLHYLFASPLEAETSCAHSISPLLPPRSGVLLNGDNPAKHSFFFFFFSVYPLVFYFIFYFFLNFILFLNFT